MDNPRVAKTLRTVPEWVDAFRPVIQAHLGQEMRAMDVSWRLLLEHADLVSGFAFAAAKAAGANTAWLKAADAALRIPESLVNSLVDHTSDPIDLYRWRNQLAELIERKAE